MTRRPKSNPTKKSDPDHNSLSKAIQILASLILREYLSMPSGKCLGWQK